MYDNSIIYTGEPDSEQSPAFIPVFIRRTLVQAGNAFGL